MLQAESCMDLTRWILSCCMPAVSRSAEQGTHKIKEATRGRGQVALLLVHSSPVTVHAPTVRCPAMQEAAQDTHAITEPHTRQARSRLCLSTEVT